MKTFILALCAVNIAFATVYNFIAPNGVSIQSDASYEFVNEISIEVEQVLDRAAWIAVNGESTLFHVKELNSYRDGAFKVTDYEVAISEDIITDMICDEREIVTYLLRFSRKVSRGGASIVNVALDAEVSYTYDWCHSISDYTTIEYLLN